MILDLEEFYKDLEEFYKSLIPKRDQCPLRHSGPFRYGSDVSASHSRISYLCIEVCSPHLFVREGPVWVLLVLYEPVHVQSCEFGIQLSLCFREVV
jgi:hypothetical protein